MIEEGYLHLTLDKASNLVALQESFQQSAKDISCTEIRVSLAARSTFVAPDFRGLHPPDDPGRISQFVNMVQTMAPALPNVEKITFDSGLSNESSSIPLEAIGAVLSDSKALKRLDLSYVNVACLNEEHIRSWQQTLQGKRSNTATTLEQCCLDRASVVLADVPDDEDGNEENTLPLDPLISLFIRACPRLEWFTICADTFASLRPDTLINLCRAPNLRELMLWNFDLHSDQHLATVFNTISEERSAPLVRLTIPTSLNKPGAQAVAQYLRRPNTLLQGLTLTVNQFKNVENNGGSDGAAKEEAVVQDILTALASALQVNQSLQSFRIRGSARIRGSKKMFVDMLNVNYTLQYFSILNEDASDSKRSSDEAASIQMFLKLNRNGRRDLYLPEEGSSIAGGRTSPRHRRWVDLITNHRHDLNCSFYLMQCNPSVLLGGTSGQGT